MFGIGFGEFILLSLIILVLIGPKQLPQVMKTLGKFARELSKAKDELKTTIDQDDSLRSLKESMGDVRKSVKSQVDEIKGNLHAKLIAEQEAADRKEKEALEKKKNES